MPVLRDLTVSQYVATREDPRIDRTKDHALRDMILITLCAVICGADSWVAVEEFGNAKRAWLPRLTRNSSSTASCSGCRRSSTCGTVTGIWHDEHDRDRGGARLDRDRHRLCHQ